MIRKYIFKYSVDGGHYKKVTASSMSKVKMIVKLRHPEAQNIKVKRGQGSGFHDFHHARIE